MSRIFPTLLILISISLNIWSQNSLLEEFPWLTDIYNTDSCEELAITEYDLGPYSFLLVSDGNVYYQDGTYYCDNNAIDCITAYGLDDAIEVSNWSCGVDTIVNNVEDDIMAFILENAEASVGEEICLGVKTSGFDDVISFQLALVVSNDNLRFLRTQSSFLSSTDIVYNEEIGEVRTVWIDTNLSNGDINDETVLFEICYVVENNINGGSQVVQSEGFINEIVTQITEPTFQSMTFKDIIIQGGIITISEATEPTMPDTTEIDTVDNPAVILPFEAYPWLEPIVQAYNCEHLVITEYDFTAYSFFVLDDGDMSQMFYQDGTFYCEDSASTDCRSIYNLTDDIATNVWSCSGNTENSDSGNENIPNNEEPDSSSVDTLDNLFLQFEWLQDIVSCSEGLFTVEEYKSGSFSFIYVISDDGSALYFQDGTFYCKDAENFDCLSAYQLSDLVDSWNCGEAKEDKMENRSKSKVSMDQLLTIYPNPSNGLFYFNSEVQGNVQLFEVDGKFVKNIPVRSNLIDLRNEKSAVYVLRIQQDGHTITKRLVKM